MINLNHLKYFYHCAQSGQVSTAAQNLGIAQPSLSIQLKTFEKEIGFPLFVRTGRGLQLTPRGDELFKKASSLFASVQDIEKYIQTDEVEDAIYFRVGVSDNIERPFVADLLGQLIRTQAPKKISASIISKSQTEILALANKEGLDIFISDRKVAGLHLVDEYKIPVMLISHKNIHAAKAQALANPELLLHTLGQDLVQPTGDLLFGQETLAFIKSKKIKTDVAIRSNILACVVRSVQDGAGAAFLPVLYVDKELKKNTLSAYGPPNGFWKHRIFLYAKNKKKAELITLFAQIIRKLTLPT